MCKKDLNLHLDNYLMKYQTIKTTQILQSINRCN